MKIFYRISDNRTNQGLWYSRDGKFTGLIHGKFNFCMNSNLQMPYDPEIVGYLSATMELNDLFNWFSEEDILQLEEHGYRINIYEATDYKFHHNHWVINEKTSVLVHTTTLGELLVNA